MAKTNGGRGKFSRHFTRRDFLSTSLKAGTAAAFTTGLLPSLNAKSSERYNVLFIVVDDLRPLLGCYGHSEMHTPNIDRFAERGTLFSRAYCQYPLCNPSRVSMITGLRPGTAGVLDNSTNFRDILPNVITLPQHFKEHGYRTQAIGRVLHIHELQNDERAWSVRSWGPRWIPFDKASTPSWEAVDAEDHELRDGQTADKAGEVLEVLAALPNNPFFLAVGFYKPHLRYKAPRKYYDLYNSVTFNIHTDSMTPEGVPPLARTYWNEIRGYQDLLTEVPRVSDEKILELTRAYAASISYTDALVGRVLQQLDALNLTENTVIVLVGDHGYHLGEHGTWGKNTLFEVGVHSPLIISIPGQQPNRVDAFAELVDIYPTLCDACELPTPSELEGLSLMPVIEQPTHPWKTATFSEIKRRNIYGYSIRTEQYRYTEWGPDGSRGRELYNYDADPDETVNVVDLPENAELVEHLSERLHAGWQAALPDTQQQTPVPETLPWDINNDGVVDIQDLILVSNSFGMETREHPKVDVNKDGNVDIIDLLLVAAHFGKSNSPAAPPAHLTIGPKQFGVVEKWLAEARLVDDGSDIFREGIATLEHLINTAVPSKTVLLPNYPNPFNPETWIPYDLAEDADVHIDIYSLKGESVRRLSVGFQTAGTYRTQSRAAYWDGQNAVGEPVASGIYFYTFQAGQFRATRQMVILK
ncbi:MAG: sulfatase-like hydrolase/transferase [Candidatus Poribacteria bacterium]|nr:sulfatase-like hydrolase/transferase [Candidatus Poribacteria bacterium]